MRVILISIVAFGLADRSIEEALENLDKLAINPERLAHWTNAIETSAKSMCGDTLGKIKFRYKIKERVMAFFVSDSASRDCLVKSIEIHLPSIPESLQGFFSVLKYDLKNVKFS
jgi:hypothetical protein